MGRKLTYECTSDYLKHRQGILALRERSYGTISPDRYDSLYLGNPYGEPLLGLSFDGEKIVGQEAYIPQKIACGGTIYEGALGVDTLVDPQYRVLYGVFGKLCQLTIDDMESRADVLCAYANEESKPYYLKYFQWHVASRIRVYKKVTGWSGFKRESLLSIIRPGGPVKDVAFEETGRFEPGKLDPVIEEHARNASYASIFKTSEFLNWKFLSNKHYRVTGYYIVREGRVRGYCVTCDDGIERKILDVLVENDDAHLLKRTISWLTHQSRREGMRRLVIYATPGCWYESILRRQAFIGRWDFEFIVKAFGKHLSAANWVIHIGDFDVF